MSNTADSVGESDCGFHEVGGYELVEKAVNYCPSCGAEATGTTTPTMFKCSESGEVFYVER